MLTVEHLDSCYGESRILSDLNLDVPDGKIACLIGRNGVGKTTTLKSIMGLVHTPSGKICLNGRQIEHLPTYERARLGIGYVPQGREIFPRLTVEENMEIGLRARGKKGRSPEYLFDLFPMLTKFSHRMGGDLSGGQQQMLAIARALAAEPDILILDEPTEGIQPSIIENIGEAIKRINAWKGLTVLIVEQYLDFVLGISQELYVMNHGEIALQGKTKDIDPEQIRSLMT